MSEPRIISPLLDGYALGNSMSCHSGVNCYPAMRMDSDERYIVKTISIPASQTQLEALLLTGAYPDPESARNYFKDLTRGIRDEVEILDKLAAQRGFLPFNGYQIAPLAQGVGFEFYLISPYRRSLQRFLKRSPMTHLAAVNMGIDLCAALSLCREAGYLYVDLKPSNVFLSGEQEFQIGDLGFVSLDSLKYASLPDRCRSSWIPPEVADAYSTMNTTMDTYALGLILYQVYNNGALPFDSEESRQALMAQMAAGEALPAPAYADYEMAQIIAKACAYNPEDRWTDPSEMGHALIAYMQRNGANDVPIGPPVVTDNPLFVEVPSEELPSDEAEAEISEENAEQTQEEMLPEAEDDGEEAVSEEEAEETPDDSGEENWLDRMDAILAEDSEDGEDENEDGLILRQILSDEDAISPEEDPADVDTDVLSEETAGILSQADELIAHEAPQPAVAPEPIDVPMPEPIVLEDEEEDPLNGEDMDDNEAEPSDEEEPSEEEYDEDDYYDEDEAKPKKGKKILGWIIGILVLALLGAGGYFGYTEYYLQEITALSVTGEADAMTVSVSTEMDQSLLSVVCVDQYGTKQTSALTNGTATFTGLAADTQYTVTLEVEGLHKLIGQTTAQHYTLPQTNVVSFTAVTGPEDGSVILSFMTEGPAVESWTVEYAAEGLSPVAISFTGNMITIPGLTPGTAYTFTLLAGDDVYLVGQTQITYTAATVIYAENLAVTDCHNGTITTTWTVPEGVSVTGWTARCYNESGYDQTLNVTETTASFTDVDPAYAYTVEVTAADMTQSSRTYITANPITISAIDTSNVTTASLAVTWTFEGNAPEGGWLLLYTVDQGSEQHVVQCDEAVAVIEPVIPGCHYDLTIQAANSATVFGGSSTVDIPEAESFSQMSLSASEIRVTLCKVPDKDNWTYKDVEAEAETNTFASGEKVGIMLYTASKYSTKATNMTIVYVIRDSENGLAAVSTVTESWADMWNRGHCELEVSQLPSEAGSYTLEIYMGGQLLTTQEITIQ